MAPVLERLARTPWPIASLASSGIKAFNSAPEDAEQIEATFAAKLAAIPAENEETGTAKIGRERRLVEKSSMPQIDNAAMPDAPP
jgi:hypothetical protein